MDDIARRTRDVLAARLGPAAAQATDGARFVEDLHATSLDQVELIMSIEDAFGIEIPDSASEKMFTVGDLVAFVETAVKGKREAA
jgi:acyl carrier protein